MSASLGPNYDYDKLFFCHQHHGANGSNPDDRSHAHRSEPWPVPTYTGAFLATSSPSVVSPTPFTPASPGTPRSTNASRATVYADLTNITFSDIKVVTGSNALATNWSIISATRSRRTPLPRRPVITKGSPGTADKPLSVVRTIFPCLTAPIRCTRPVTLSERSDNVGSRCQFRHRTRFPATRSWEASRRREPEDRRGDGRGHDAEHADGKYGLRRSWFPGSPGNRLWNVSP